ncbi:MAG: beta-galactosidase [Clostridiales bacterium]|nr:beta-galactosidase [Clostridiales bacterium]
MQYLNIDREWEFRRGFADSFGMLGDESKKIIDLPHDSMISLAVTPDAPAGYDSGYFPGDMCNYTKYVMIPEEWRNQRIGLRFDGVMMHATVEINGSKAGEHHYGYSPFYIDITDHVAFGQENRITINTNTGIQSSSRWYSGCGLFRGVKLCHAPAVHIRNDGVFVYTKEISDGMAWLEARVDVCNETMQNRLAQITIRLVDEADGRIAAETSRTIQVDRVSTGTARMAFSMKDPKLWDADEPNLYTVRTKVKDTGIFTTHFIRNEEITEDEDEKLFGIRTVTVDAERGLRINNRTVKLKGGCVHHDNGLLGAVSLYECEARKVRKLKETGFNAIRTAHNPPSEALVEACDREGMYIFDEAFDAWGMAKRPGDFSTYFSERWETELDAFVRRDRIHPSVIMWSTGNEIPERGGLNSGYTLAAKLAEAIHERDGTRPVSNGTCSFWCGLDDFLAKGKDPAQNAPNFDETSTWDRLTEPFTNGLDVVGYNYMEDLYEGSHKLFPDRVILGSENFPKEIGFRWPLVEKLPYVIGDFTWTAWDYIGEAGIGKSIFAEPDDPLVKQGSWAIMPPTTSPYPWRLANDADFDITGRMRPQGAYRSVIWGSDRTYLYVQHPDHFGKAEVISMWGFTDVQRCWNYHGCEQRPIELTVFSNADEVALYINGRMIERKTVSRERPLPDSVRFRTVYEPGTVEAVSYRNGREVSRDKLETAKAPAGIRIVPERRFLKADGHDVVFTGLEVVDEDGRTVPDAAIRLRVSVSGAGYMPGLGTGNPVTEEDYTDGETVTYQGCASAVIRGGYKPGKIVLSVRADEYGFAVEDELTVE